MERDGFVFYRSFAEALALVDEQTQLQCYRAIVNYGIYGIEPVLDGIALAVFTLVKPQIDANNKRYTSGTKGGRPRKTPEEKPTVFKTKTEPKPKQNQTETKRKPKTAEIFEELKDKYEASLSNPMIQILSEWFSYKDSIKKPLGEKSVEHLIKQSIELERKYGYQKVCKCFEDSIKNGYQGVFFDKIESATVKKMETRDEILQRFIAKGE